MPLKRRSDETEESINDAMTDVIFIIVTIGFFATAWGYCRLCELL
jgi:hypothetical protein